MLDRILNATLSNNLFFLGHLGSHQRSVFTSFTNTRNTRINSSTRQTGETRMTNSQTGSQQGFIQINQDDINKGGSLFCFHGGSLDTKFLLWLPSQPTLLSQYLKQISIQALPRTSTVYQQEPTSPPPYFSFLLLVRYPAFISSQNLLCFFPRHSVKMVPRIQQWKHNSNDHTRNTYHYKNNKIKPCVSSAIWLSVEGSYCRN